MGILTVAEALTIGELKRTKLVAGEKGLDRPIRHVTVMEVPDIVQWLKGGDFIITSFYAVHDSLDKQLALIRELSKLNSAALAIKINRYIEKIPIELIEEANKYNFPIIEMPREVTYIDIMTPLMNHLFEIRSQRAMVEDYMKEIIFNSYKSSEGIVERGKTIGINIDEGFFGILTLDIDDFEGIAKKVNFNQEKLNTIKESLYRAAEATGKDLIDLLDLVQYMVIGKSDSVSLILQCKSKESWDKIKGRIEGIIMGHKEYYLNKTNITIGVGNISTGPKGIEESYSQSISALKIGKVLGKKETLFFYSDLVVFDILTRGCQNGLKDIIDNTIGRILGEEELMESLFEYYEHNGDLTESSGAMFIHKNTMKYRLNRIKNLTGLDVRKVEDNFKLSLGMFAYRYLSKRTKTT